MNMGEKLDLIGGTFGLFILLGRGAALILIVLSVAGYILGWSSTGALVIWGLSIFVATILLKYICNFIQIYIAQR